MDENSALIDAILREDKESRSINNYTVNDDHEWHTVSYQKRNRKKTAKRVERFSDLQRLESAASGNVFQSIEHHSEERRLLLEARRELAAAEFDGVDEEDGSDVEASAGADNDGAKSKEAKPKRPKKRKVTVAEAAAKIDASDLAAFLVDITETFESQQDIQLMRFADYFGRAFASVRASQFPWMKALQESSVEKMVDIPLSYISEAVYKASTDWLNKQSIEALGSFVLWSWENILADLAIHQGAAKGSKKLVQPTPSKSQVAIFVVLAMTLRQKPGMLNSLMPIISENPKYRGQDKLPITVWLIAQASQGDLVVGLLMWVHFLLPMLSSKSSCNPQSRDLILQLVERIVSGSKASSILLNGAVRKGERLVPPSALELLMRSTFPASSARVKATERLEIVYPTLKEIALSGSPGSKALKQITQKILQFAVKAAGEGVPDLSREASNISIWCLTQNPDCYKQWDDLYLDNLEASVVLLGKLADEWKDHSIKHHTFEPLKVALSSFRQKNEKALATEQDVARQETFKEAEKHCKVLMGHLSRSSVWMKRTLFLSLALVVVAAFMSTTFHSHNMDTWDLKRILVDFDFP